ncbi:MAG: hypothetical protein P1V51_24375 [Deltaproteobacteria bacterium]|nr:hypothetical protein [Deltaproteobacteria bacterium]
MRAFLFLALLLMAAPARASEPEGGEAAPEATAVGEAPEASDSTTEAELPEAAPAVEVAPALEVEPEPEPDAPDPAPRPCIPLGEDEERVAVSFVGLQTDTVSDEARRTLESLIIEALEEKGRVEVRTRDDLRLLLDEQAARWLAGCTDLECQQEATQVLQSANTPLLLTATLSRAGGRSILQLSLFSNTDGSLVGRTLGRARGHQKLQEKLPRIAANLLSRARLLREGLDPTGFPAPRFHLTLKLGNALSRIAALDRNLLAYRMDIETNLYVTPKALVFLVVGMALGGGDAGGSADALRLKMIPASFGAKRLWTFNVLRAWVGAGIGPGVLGLTNLSADGERDFRSAFAVTVVAGGDYRIHRRWTLAAEVSTNLTDAVLGLGSGDAEVPVVFGLTLGASFLFF